MNIGERPVVIDSADAHRYTAHGIKRTVASRRSHRQLCEIIELERYGPSLWIDGRIQWALADEHIYHQLLCHVALSHHPSPKDVLVIGGGDLLAAWRIGMREKVESIKIADWDTTLFPFISDTVPEIAALDIERDPRIDFEHELDVAEYLPATEDRFDAIIIDLTDASDLARLVPDAVEHLWRILKKGGVVAALGPDLSLSSEPRRELKAMLDSYRSVFQSVWVVGYPVESFSIVQSVFIAWKDRAIKMRQWTWHEISKRFDRLGLTRDHSFYSPEIHRAATSIIHPELRGAFWLAQ